jgi:hypothetical protein
LLVFKFAVVMLHAVSWIYSTRPKSEFQIA